MNEYTIEKYNNSKKEILMKIKYKIPENKITFSELKEDIIKQDPKNFKNDDIIEINGYVPPLEKIIPRNINIIKFIQNNENENYNDNNNIEQNEENENENKEEEEEEEEEESDDSGKPLNYLLEKVEKKNQNILNKKRNRNENSKSNMIELDENFQIISDFAPTRKELYNKLFIKDFSENLDYNKNKRIYFNPEKYAKVNNLKQYFFDGEELIDTIVDNDNKFNEENKDLINNRIGKEYQKKGNIIIEKNNDNIIEIKKEKEIKNETLYDKIKKEKEIKKETLYDKIIKENDNNNIISNQIPKTINEIEKEGKIKQEEFNNKFEQNKENEFEVDNEFEFYDLYGDLNREGIKKHLLDLYHLAHPNFKERIKYSKLIYQISQLCPQIKKKKLNFVFDLDSTLICAKTLDYSKLDIVKEKYKSLDEYFQFMEVYNSAFQIQNVIVNFRYGIKSLFKKIKDISNLYIYTLSLETYATKIKNYIEELCNVKFEKIIYYIPNNNEKRAKFFDKLNINRFNSLILDDSEEAWIDNIIRHKCIINSMSYCCDKTYLIANETYSEKRNKGLLPYFYFNIITSQNDNWLGNRMMVIYNNPFREMKSGRYFHIETENSNKKQLEYIGNLYVTVYNIMEFMNFQTISAMDAIKMIRITIFAGMIFDISAYIKEEYNILRVLIISNGGEIYNGNNYYDGADYVFICNRINYQQYKNKIEKIKSKYNYFHLINEKYVFECSFCMTKFSLEDPEYIIEEE